MSPPRNIILLALLLVLTLTGCTTSSHITNTRIAEGKPSDYKHVTTGHKNQRSPDVDLVLALSGGGTRAAAFSYGVLEKLRDTRYMDNGVEKRMLDEVDVISSVSGSSFTAAYYTLYGERIFDDFEELFLRRNIQKDLIHGLFNPLNWFRGRNRTETAIDYYDRNLFKGSTFSDIHASNGPHLEINATDLAIGERFAFTQDYFNMLCSDLDSFKVARAVAASSAVPVAFLPIILENYSGCNFQDPSYVVNARRYAADTPRGAALIESFESYKDKEDRRFIHLVDGGISDNLGIRPITNHIEAVGGALSASGILGYKPRYLIVIVVNSETSRERPMGRSTEPPSTKQVVSAVSSAQIGRYNLESLALLDESMQEWAAELSTPERPVKAFLIILDFKSIAKDDVRLLFNNMATSFSLSDEEVDMLIEAGHRLLDASPDFQNLLETIQRDQQ